MNYSYAKIKFFTFVSIILLLFLLHACEKDLSVTPIRDPLPEGKLFIYSTPPGHFIYIDGKNTGQVTPDTIKWLKTNSYVVTLKRPLWRDTSFSMIASDNFLLDTNINLLSNPKMYGSIKFSSDPSGCSIYLNDSLLAQKTEFTLRHLLPGYYKVKYTKAEHRDIEKVFTVESNKQTAAYLAPQDTSIWVDYNTKNSNIPFDFLKCIAVDQNNIKWIGTLNQGIIKFDGKNYEWLKTSNTPLPTNWINNIIVANDNKKWICTEQGVAIYDDLNWEVITKSNAPLMSANVNTIEFEDDGTTWFGTTNGLVRKYFENWDTFIMWAENDTLYPSVSTHINGISIRAKDDIWVSTPYNSIYKFEEHSKRFNRYGRPLYFKKFVDYIHGFPSFKIVDLEQDKFGNTWFIHDYDPSIHIPVFPDRRLGGISVLAANDTTFKMDRWTTPDNQLEDIYIDNNDLKWIPSEIGLYVVDQIGQRYLYNFTSSKLPFAHLTSIAKDKIGYYWCTSQGGGLLKFKNK